MTHVTVSHMLGIRCHLIQFTCHPQLLAFVRPDPNGTQTPARIERDMQKSYRDAPEKILLTEASPLQTPSSFVREKASGFDARD